MFSGKPWLGLPNIYLFISVAGPPVRMEYFDWLIHIIPQSSAPELQSEVC